jgi:hypothetical protein
VGNNLMILDEVLTAKDALSTLLTMTLVSMKLRVRVARLIGTPRMMVSLTTVYSRNELEYFEMEMDFRSSLLIIILVFDLLMDRPRGLRTSCIWFIVFVSQMEKISPFEQMLAHLLDALPIEKVTKTSSA